MAIQIGKDVFNKHRGEAGFLEKILTNSCGVLDLGIQIGLANGLAYGKNVL